MPPNTDYWKRACQLLREGRSKEAERLVKKGVGSSNPWELQCASLYESRAKELHKQGDDKLAREAAKRAKEFMADAARQATSSADALGISQACSEIEQHLEDMLGCL